MAPLNGKRIDATLEINTLIAPQKNKANEDLIVHSNQNYQNTIQNIMKKYIRQDMSKSGCPYNNSVMESFWIYSKLYLLDDIHSIHTVS